MPPTFDALGVPTDLVSTLHARGIREPFPIQALTVADGVAGRDLSGRAPTGSGKTLAFGIPLVARVSGAKPKRPRGLVLVPTRELAAQVCSELEWLGHGRKLRIAAIYGGVGFGAQLKALRRGVDIVVACPGRLTDLIDRKECSLRDVTMAVVDEADRMADMGFLPAVRKLLDQTPDTRQTLLFSATLDGVVDTLVRGYQRSPVRHELPDVDVDVAPAVHHFWRVEREDRVRRCAEVVKAVGPTIVFCKTKRGTDTVARKLEQAGVRTAAIHGNRSQGQRERALAQFARGDVQALAATDVAARGIHVDGVACVVHFDPPNDAKDYTHRSGRTARAGASGIVVSLVLNDQVRSTRQIQSKLALPLGLDNPRRTDLGELTKARPVAIRAVPNGAEDAPSGKVKWYDPRKGYGFIERTGEADLFVHHSHLDDTVAHLEEGEFVEFEIGPGKRGEEARRVRRAA